jgi:hypothetical protein
VKLIHICEIQYNTSIILGDFNWNKTYLRVEFKSAVGGEHHDRGWTKWILCRKKDAKMIETAFKFSARRTTKSAMPFLCVKGKE